MPDESAALLNTTTEAPARGALRATRWPPLRYLRLHGSFARACLTREMSFRTNFLVRCCTHAVWLTLQLVFFETLFLHTERIGDWDKHSYLFFLGTFLTLNALVNCLFIGNCRELAELIRTGDLDFLLLRPVDEQFLLSGRRVDWAMVPEVLFSLGLPLYATLHLGQAVTPARVVLYGVLLLAGLALLYSLLLALAALSVWTVRHRELHELWFCLMALASYPPEAYKDSAAGACLGFAFTYLLPILLAVNVPARVGALLLQDWKMVAYLFLAAGVALTASRWFFRFALRRYQSTSS